MLFYIDVNNYKNRETEEKTFFGFCRTWLTKLCQLPVICQVLILLCPPFQFKQIYLTVCNFFWVYNFKNKTIIMICNKMQKKKINIFKVNYNFETFIIKKKNHSFNNSIKIFLLYVGKLVVSNCYLIICVLPIDSIKRSMT